MYVELRDNKRVYLIAANRKILSFSEQYATHWNAQRAAKKMYPNLEIVDRNGHIVQAADATYAS